MGMMQGPVTKPAVRLQYILLFLMFVVSAVGMVVEFLLGHYVTWVQWVMGCMTVAHLVTGWGAWKYGAPYYTRRT